MAIIKRSVLLPGARESKHCVFWHGDVSPEDGSPIITLVKPGESSPTDVSVLRVLVFLYAGKHKPKTLHFATPFLLQRRTFFTLRRSADDDSFDELQEVSAGYAYAIAVPTSQCSWGLGYLATYSLCSEL